MTATMMSGLPWVIPQAVKASNLRKCHWFVAYKKFVSGPSTTLSQVAPTCWLAGKAALESTTWPAPPQPVLASSRAAVSRLKYPPGIWRAIAFIETSCYVYVSEAGWPGRKHSPSNPLRRLSQTQRVAFLCSINA